MADRIEPVEVPIGAGADDAPDGAPEPPRVERVLPRASIKLRDQIAELYATIGAVVVTPIDQLGGYLLAANAEELADQWVALAETNPAVKRALQRLVEVGGVGGIIMAHGMILLPVLANRGMLPDQVAMGTAVMTQMAHPESAALFTHDRFKSNGNGNAAS